MTEAYGSGLEVAGGHDGLEVAPNPSPVPPRWYQHPQSQTQAGPGQPIWQNTGAPIYYTGSSAPSPPSKIEYGTQSSQGRPATGGTPARKFWWILGGIVICFVAIIAIVGGVLGSQLASRRNEASPATSSSSTSSSSSSTTAAATNPSSPTSITSPSFSSVTSFASTVTYLSTPYPVEQSPAMATLVAGNTTTLIDCPYSNNTAYTDPSTNLTFVRRCGVNAVLNDIVNFTAYNFEDCMSRCASSHASGNGCAAVVWIWAWDGATYAATGPFFNRCYLKNALWPANIVWNWQSELGFIIPT